MKTMVKKGYVLRLGIDGFKEIRIYRGIAYGDMLSGKTEECIRAAVTADQKVYRIAVGEFIVTGSKSAAWEGEELYHRIREGISRLIEENGHQFFFTVSAGELNFSDIEDHSYESMMRAAEFALMKAGRSGRNTFYIYANADYAAFNRREELLQALHRAVCHDFEGFETYFQPIVGPEGGIPLSAETLLRFRSGKTGQVSPSEFIPLLEESGLIIPTGRWVIHQAMKACSEIRKTIPGFQISVNVSYIQILKSDLLRDLAEAMEIYALPKGSMIIELTESGFVESNACFAKFCSGLKDLGIFFALDDFGTGYSNFHYLYNLSPNTIKIDRSFTAKALEGEWEYRLLQHMVEMTHSIDLKLCIEGIETKEELERISRINPDYIQGFYFGKPSPLERFLKEYVNDFRKIQ